MYIQNLRHIVLVYCNIWLLHGIILDYTSFMIRVLYYTTIHEVHNIMNMIAKCKNCLTTKGTHLHPVILSVLHNKHTSH